MKVELVLGEHSTPLLETKKKSMWTFLTWLDERKDESATNDSHSTNITHKVLRSFLFWRYTFAHNPIRFVLENIWLLFCVYYKNNTFFVNISVCVDGLWTTDLVNDE